MIAYMGTIPRSSEWPELFERELVLMQQLLKILVAPTKTPHWKLRILKQINTLAYVRMSTYAKHYNCKYLRKYCHVYVQFEKLFKKRNSSGEHIIIILHEAMMLKCYS